MTNPSLSSLKRSRYRFTQASWSCAALIAKPPPVAELVFRCSSRPCQGRPLTERNTSSRHGPSGARGPDALSADVDDDVRQPAPHSLQGQIEVFDGELAGLTDEEERHIRLVPPAEFHAVPVICGEGHVGSAHLVTEAPAAV